MLGFKGSGLGRNLSDSSTPAHETLPMTTLRVGPSIYIYVYIYIYIYQRLIYFIKAILTFLYQPSIFPWFPTVFLWLFYGSSWFTPGFPLFFFLNASRHPLVETSQVPRPGTGRLASEQRRAGAHLGHRCTGGPSQATEAPSHKKKRSTVLARVIPVVSTYNIF